MTEPVATSGDTPRRGRARRRLRGDRGAVDVGIEMLFGAVIVIAVFVFIIEVGAYWHARNVLDEAAAEGVRVAAAFDGTCAEGEAVARDRVSARAGSWAAGVAVSCSDDGEIVTVEISSTTPGMLSSSTGYQASVTESAPRER